MTVYNLIVAYDLMNPGQNYNAVHARIKSLGTTYHAQQSLYYVHTSLSAADAHRLIMEVMDGNDKLMVVAAQNAVMYPAPPETVAAINQVWFQPA